MGLVIAAFIIAAVFVGYHASQESHEKTTEGQVKSIELEVLNNQAIQTTQVPYVKADMSESIR